MLPKKLIAMRSWRRQLRRPKSLSRDREVVFEDRVSDSQVRGIEGGCEAASERACHDGEGASSDGRIAPEDSYRLRAGQSGLGTGPRGCSQSVGDPSRILRTEGRDRFIRSATSNARTTFAGSGVSDEHNRHLGGRRNRFRNESCKRRNRGSRGTRLVRSSVAREQDHKSIEGWRREV